MTDELERHGVRSDPWTVEDRYLYDHPGPDWKTKPKFIRGVDDLLGNHRFDGTWDERYRPKKGEPAWDEEQFFGSTLENWPVKVTPTSSETGPESVKTTLMRESSVWLCRICRNQPAHWPREISWRRVLWGVRFQIFLRTPLACENCRIMRFREFQALGRLEHRHFWQNLIALWDGEPYPTTSYRMRRAIRWRNAPLTMAQHFLRSWWRRW